VGYVASETARTLTIYVGIRAAQGLDKNTALP
jgi:hypothetical protein